MHFTDMVNLHRDVGININKLLRPTRTPLKPRGPFRHKPQFHLLGFHAVGWHDCYRAACSARK